MTPVANIVDVDIFIPCFVDQLFPQSAWNMVKVLEQAGCTVHYNSSQTCCGQPAWNAGFREKSQPVAEKLLEDFDTGRNVIIPSASCAGMICNSYSTFFHNTSLHLKAKNLKNRVYEFSTYLVDVLNYNQATQNISFNAKVAYHDSCSALRELNIVGQPRKLLQQVNGLELVEFEDATTCCGFGGTFAVKFEAISTAMAEQKVNNILNSGATAIVSTDLSCLMHLDAYIKKAALPLKTYHIADILAGNT